MPQFIIMSKGIVLLACKFSGIGKKMNRKRGCGQIFLLFLCGVIGLAACQSTAVTPTPTQQAITQAETTPTNTRTPSRTPTKTATSAPAATNTKSPTATPSPIPTETLTPSPTTTPLPTPTPTVPLVIAAFTATLEDYEPGGKNVTFAWAVSGASLVRIYSGTNQYFAKWWDVTEQSRYTVALGRTMFRNPTMTLIARNDGGDVVLKTIVVPWECDVAYFFSPPPLQCAWHEPTYSNAIEQPFENGRMIWIDRIRQDDVMLENRLYVFADPNRDGIGNWRRYDDVTPGTDTFNEPPPEGLLEPQGRFGEVWRQNEALRRDIGWATAPEASFEAVWQYQLTEAGTAASYLRTVDGRVIELFGSRLGGWRYIGTDE